jgi:hypothetical protein
MMGKLPLSVVIMFGAAMWPQASAQERIVPIVASGQWEASMYQPSITAPPTVCVVYNHVAGSTRATNAFRTCARLPGADAGPGSNPFR